MSTIDFARLPQPVVADHQRAAFQAERRADQAFRARGIHAGLPNPEGIAAELLGGTLGHGDIRRIVFWDRQLGRVRPGRDKSRR